MAEPAANDAHHAGTVSHAARGPMNWFIDFIELVAAVFVGIVAADIFISVHAALLLQRADTGQPTISAGCCSAF